MTTFGRRIANVDVWDQFRKTVFTGDDEGPRDSQGVTAASFAVITAWNKNGRVGTKEENQADDQQLPTILSSMGVRKVRMTGWSPDFSHGEPGWAVAVPKEEAVRLGKQFGQLAIFWVENDRLFLVPCLDEDHQEEELGSWRRALHRTRDV